MTDPGVSLLIIDDNPASLELLSASLAQPGLAILTASTGAAGLDLFFAHRPAIVVIDLVMPDVSGLEILNRIMICDPVTDVIVVTGHDSPEAAVEAIRAGACDYLTKPVSITVLRERIAKAMEEARGRQLAPAEDGSKSPAEFEGMIGRSPRMLELRSRIQRIARHYRTLLITGETGTGKDLIARAVHRVSPVASGRYVVLNCSAVVETLFESELFGHVKGSFTGAVHDKPGLVEHAHGGTLFLDEIGDMPLASQAKLLRVLQNQEVQRVGALSPRKVDVRVIAATNRDLRAEVAARRFREDLFYRLSMVEIQAPKLTDRREDFPLLERYFIERYASQYGKTIRGLTQRAHLLLAQHRWPGNVREFENVLGHAAMMTTRDVIDIDDLPHYLREAAHATVGPPGEPSPFAEQERLLLLRALQSTGGNQSKAADILQIGRDALRYKIRKHQIKVPGHTAAAAG